MGGSAENDTRLCFDAGGASGDTSRRGSSGEGGGEEHLILLALGGSSNVSAPSKLSNERLLVIPRTDKRTESMAV